jgi:phosphorylcholine metabolism protein LicD
MTEADRLIAEGFVPEDFFKEEYICGYLVTKKQKKIWAIELDILMHVKEVCERHNLRWTLYNGSLLGSIRSQGFVPWDDDLDIAMPYEDYEKLMTLQSELPDYIFLQNYKTDPGFAYSIGKVRNSRTTCISRKFRYEKWNQGIFIDITPLFPFDDNIEGDDPRILRIREIGKDLGTIMRRNNPYLDYNDKARVEALSSQDISEYFRELSVLTDSCRGQKPDIYCPITQPGATGYDIHIHENELFPIQKGVFCGKEVNVPYDTLGILCKMYGNLGYPTSDFRGMNHEGLFFDPDRPYTEISDDELITLEDGILRGDKAAEGNDDNGGLSKLSFGTDEYKEFLLKCKEKADIPEEWKPYLQNRDGSYKKVMLYCTGAGKLLAEEKMIKKLRENFDVFRENKDKIALIWRPEPGVYDTALLINKGLAEEYRSLVEWYKENEIGIYDDSDDLDRAVAVADAFYGDESSVTSLCVKKGIPAMIQSAEMC